MNPLPLRGVIAPVFIALGIAAGFLDLWRDSDSLVWLGLGFLALGLVFARHTRLLFTSALEAIRSTR
jgi:hypothetical protein